MLSQVPKQPSPLCLNNLLSLEKKVGKETLTKKVYPIFLDIVIPNIFLPYIALK